MAYKYLEAIIEEEIGRQSNHYSLSLIPLLIIIAGIVFLPLTYIETPKGNYSYGPAAFMAYIGVAIYVFYIIMLMLQHGKKLPIKKKMAVYIALISEIPLAVYQICVPVALVTCLGIVLLNLGFYLTTENPDAILAEQLKKEKKRADTANAAKTTFLANMSHEIRTPITAVLGMNELILRESQEPETKKYAQNIDVAAKSLLSIINDILDITKIEAGKLSVICAEYNFAALLKDIINMVSFKADVKELKFKTLIDENIPIKMMGDDIRLKQILVNILNNAVKYTQEGTVTLEISGLPTDNEKMAKLLFKIKDTGIGMKEEDVQRICEPFARFEEKRNRNIEGTGLGMSITKRLLELLGSNLQVCSVYGEGSEFSFVLLQEIVDARPIGKLEDYHESVLYAYKPSYEAPGARILIVDDNALNRKVFVSLLKETKMQIDEAVNGREALRLVTENRYDIIFMDHMMPEMDGLEAFSEMKKMEDYPSKNAPVVILTANAIVGEKEKYLKTGFNAFLEKPIDYKKLESLIRKLLDEKLLSEFTGARTNTEERKKALPIIEGLDWNYARMHVNDEQVLEEVVRLFVDSIEYEAKELEQLFVNIDSSEGRKKYCTKAHSMKNSAATIGIVPLAGMAKVLEVASHENDMETLISMTPIFLKNWRSYKGKLKIFEEKKEQEKKLIAQECCEEINRLLQKIKMAAEEMDIDELDAAWAQLEKYQFDEDKRELVNNIHKAIMKFDVDFLQEEDNLRIYS
ncbi:MAG: response regulator [Lachnospiraceae bacterium]|nr:response regulator [Lachnospiraceae bacterium]